MSRVRTQVYLGATCVQRHADITRPMRPGYVSRASHCLRFNLLTTPGVHKTGECETGCGGESPEYVKCHLEILRPIQLCDDGTRADTPGEEVKMAEVAVMITWRYGMGSRSYPPVFRVDAERSRLATATITIKAAAHITEKSVHTTQLNLPNVCVRPSKPFP